MARCCRADTDPPSPSAILLEKFPAASSDRPRKRDDNESLLALFELHNVAAGGLLAKRCPGIHQHAPLGRIRRTATARATFSGGMPQTVPWRFGY
jgi:hypothetical protein